MQLFSGYVGQWHDAIHHTPGNRRTHYHTDDAMSPPLPPPTLTLTPTHPLGCVPSILHVPLAGPDPYVVVLQPGAVLGLPLTQDPAGPGVAKAQPLLSKGRTCMKHPMVHGRCRKVHALWSGASQGVPSVSIR